MNYAYINSLEIRNQKLPTISLNDIAPGLNVVYGPNESGKSRIKEFIEWMMFSQSSQFQNLTHQARKAAFSTIESGIRGSLEITNGDNHIILNQSLDGTNINASLANSSMPIDDLLHILNDGIALAHYRNVFSLNLDALTEKQSHHLLSEDQIAEVFLSATQTGSGVSLSALVGELKAKKDELFSNSGNATKRTINKLIKDISDIDKEIRIIRREQRDALSYTSDLESLNRENSDLKLELKSIDDQLNLYQLTKNYAQSFEQYNLLTQAEQISVNVDLVGEIVTIKELLNQCEHHEGDEKLLNQHLVDIKNMSTELENSKIHLSKILDPDLVSNEVFSTDFRADIKEEELSSNQYKNNHSRLQEEFNKENALLVNLTKRADELTEQKSKLEKKNILNPNDETKDSEPRKKSASAKSIMSIFAITAGIAVSIASFAANQLIGVVAGVILAAFGAVLTFNKQNGKQELQLAEPFAIESIEISNIAREIDSTFAQIKQKEATITTIVESLGATEKARENERNKFSDKIESLGFSRELSAIHLNLYLEDFEKYEAKKIRFEEMKTTSEALSKWFENFFDSIAFLKTKAALSEHDLANDINTISKAKTWLEMVLEVANENKKLEKQLHERDSEIRTLEKSLVAQFSSMENAKNHFANNNQFKIEEKISALIEKKESIEAQISSKDQEIGSIKKSAEHAGQETALQDCLTKRQALLEELNESHHDYMIAYSAYELAEKAFSKCQRESQPEVLQKAAQFFSVATNGKWNAINIELAESNRQSNNKIQMSVSNDTNSIDVINLSQGTKEQLYLSLRMALMQSSSRGIHVPALFDDIAVNSDMGRFNSIAPLISQLAQSRQVFYFTCHKWVTEELAKSDNSKIHYL